MVKKFLKKHNITVDRSSTIKSAKAFIQTRKEIQKDWSIVIFTQGRIPHSAPELAPCKNEAFQMAKSAKCPILPITFINNYYLFPDPDLFFNPAMPGLVKVHVHPIINQEEEMSNDIEETKEKAYQLIGSYLPQKNH